MLAGIAIARPAPCAAQIAAATAAHASGLRDEITTFAPASAMRSAIALPMPRVEPVITVVLPASENSDDMANLLPSEPPDGPSPGTSAGSPSHRADAWHAGGWGSAR